MPEEDDVISKAEIKPQHAPQDPHHFEFDVDRGIRDQAVEKLESSPPLQMKKGIGPSKSGVYAIYLKGTLVYVGKACKTTTKSGRTLRMRLNEHVGKFDGRENLSLDDVTCRFLTFASDWWVIAAEFALIAHYRPEWNESGFGSKVPGTGRPGKPGNVNKWHEKYPRKAGWIPPTPPRRKKSK